MVFRRRCFLRSPRLLPIGLALIIWGLTAQAAAQPAVSSTSPSTAVYGVSADTAVTVWGSGFVSGATITVSGSTTSTQLSGSTVAGTDATATIRFVYVNGSQLKFWWPNTSLAPGSYDVTVTNPDATAATLTGGFSVTEPQPIVSSVVPASVTYGITPNASVTIYGDNFVLGAAITVGSLTGNTVTGQTASTTTPFVFVNRYQVKFYWPNTALAPGSYAIRVANPAAAGGLSATLADGFTVTAPQPVVSSVSPTPVTYGVSGSTAVTIYGDSFVSGATITVGSLTGNTVTGQTASATTPFIFINRSQLQFYWSNTTLAPGSYAVQVANPAAAGGFSATLAGGFTVAPPQPALSSVSPASVTWGITGSTAVTIYGDNFVVGATITVGSLTGATVTDSTASANKPFVFVSRSQLKFYWPNTALPPGTYSIQVANPASAGGLSATLANGFTVTAPQPSVSSVLPTPVTYGVSPSAALTLYGDQFIVGATVTISSPGTTTTLSGATVPGTTADSATRFVHVSAGRLSVYWSNTALAPGFYTARVANPAGAGGLAGESAAGIFEVKPPQPRIDSTVPNPVTYGSPATAISIYGADFVVNAAITISSPSTSASLSGTAVSGSSASASIPFVYVNSGRLSVYWSGTSLAAGSYTVSVTNPSSAGGLNGSLANGFTVGSAQPVLTMVVPNPVIYGVTASSAATVYGSGFLVGASVAVSGPSPDTAIRLSGAAQTSTGGSATAITPFVYIDGSRLSVYWANTSLPPGRYTISVTNPSASGGLTGSLANGFEVLPADPVISSISPSSVTYDLTSSLSVGVYGANFVT
ncbi:MAG: hypothetical protein ABIO65_06590, partial [Nitrospiria bacterium]